MNSIKKVTKMAASDSSLTKDFKASFVRQYQENVTQLFDPQTQILTQQYVNENYGLNKELESA